MAKSSLTFLVKSIRSKHNCKDIWRRNINQNSNNKSHSNNFNIILDFLIYCRKFVESDVKTNSFHSPFQIIGARHLVKVGRGIASPFVEVEVVGADYDSSNKFITKIVHDNGFNPVWNEGCGFDIINPELALLRFCVQEEDMFADPNFLGQAVFPVKSLRTGGCLQP